MSLDTDASVEQQYQLLLDKLTPHPLQRWIGLAIFVLIYALRVFTLSGFYIVTYALGIFLLNLLISFLSPSLDPALELDMVRPRCSLRVAQRRSPLLISRMTSRARARRFPRAPTTSSGLSSAACPNSSFGSRRCKPFSLPLYARSCRS